MICVVLPAHLRALAKIDGDVELPIADSAEAPLSITTVLDALEARYPALRGTMRDHQTHKRRDFVRFFACEEDLSYDPPETALPDAVRTGCEPLYVIGAIAGG